MSNFDVNANKNAYLDSVLDRVLDGSLSEDVLELVWVATGTGEEADAALAFVREADVYARFDTTMSEAVVHNLHTKFQEVSDAKVIAEGVRTSYENRTGGITLDDLFLAVGDLETAVREARDRADTFTVVVPDGSEIERLARLAARDRQTEELQEFSRVRGAWLVLGGQVRDVDIPNALMRGAEIVFGGGAVQSAIWGEIDPLRLNKGLEAYYGPRGQARLVRDIAIVANHFSLNAQRFTDPFIAGASSAERRAFLKEMGWQKLMTDWRRSVYFSSLFEREGFLERYKGESGYDQFALDYFQGDSNYAYQVASSFSTADEFAALEWGNCKRTNVREQEGIRQALREGIESGKYKGETGYDQFARDNFQGNSQKAYLVASSLLTPDEFAALGWGKLKLTNVCEQETIRQALREATESGKYKGETGYDQFALDYFQGDSQKAYQVASSLLTQDGFAALGWGKEKHRNVRDQEEIREALSGDKYIGREGRKLFVQDFIEALPNSIESTFYNAYYLARSLLNGEQMKRLDWKWNDSLETNEAEEIRLTFVEKIVANGNGKNGGNGGTKLYGGDPFGIFLQSGSDLVQNWWSGPRGVSVPATEGTLRFYGLSEADTIRGRAVSAAAKEGIPGLAAAVASPYIASHVVDPLYHPGEYHITNLAALHTLYSTGGALADVVPQIGSRTVAVQTGAEIYISNSAVRAFLAGAAGRLKHVGGLGEGVIWAYPGFVAGENIAHLFTDNQTVQLIAGNVGAIGLPVGLRAILGEQAMQRISTSALGRMAGPIGWGLLYKDIDIGLKESINRIGMSEEEVVAREQAIADIPWFERTYLEYVAAAMDLCGTSHPIYRPMSDLAMLIREKLIQDNLE